MDRLFEVVDNKYVYPLTTQNEMIELRTKFFNEEGWYASDDWILKHFGYKD